MEALILLALIAFGLCVLLLPVFIAALRNHRNTLPISACAIIGGVLTPFLIFPAALWMLAFVWSLTSPE